MACLQTIAPGAPICEHVLLVLGIGDPKPWISNWIQISFYEQGHWEIIKQWVRSERMRLCDEPKIERIHESVCAN